MKLAALFILAFIALASCHTFRPWFMQDETPVQGEWFKTIERTEETETPAPHDHGRMDNLRFFFETFFDQFNLSRPDQIIGCFCNKTSDLFFESLYGIHQILIDTNERNSIKLHLEFAKLMHAFKPLHKTYACIAETQDYTDLLDALKIKDRDPHFLMIAKYVYYQAEYPELVDDFKAVIDGLDKKDHRAAGEAYAAVLCNLVSTVKKQGLNFLAYEALQNGIAVRLDVNNPTDILECFDNESAGYYLQFLYIMARDVAEGSWKDSLYNVGVFWDQTGKELMDKIPREVGECVGKSTDILPIIEKLGVDITSDEFLNWMLKYIGESRLHFYWTMRGMKHSFDNFNLNHAGYIYGHFLEEVAKTALKNDV